MRPRVTSVKVRRRAILNRRTMSYDFSPTKPPVEPIEVRGCGPNDPDGARASAILNAYIDAEQVHVFRWLLWRSFTIIAVVAWALEAFTPVLPGIALVVVALLLGTGAVAAFVWDRRTQHTLQSLLDAQVR